MNIFFRKKVQLIFLFFYNYFFLQIILLKVIFMTASYLPSIFVPLIGLVFPAITMASLFIYIEQDEII